MKTNLNRTYIMLVEDNASIREVMVMVLESMDFDVNTAKDGKEALRQLSQAHPLPDLVISDLNMPNMSGWELVDHLRKIERTRAIPIIIHSAVANYATGDNVLTGCYFLRKPVELETLEKTIKQALSQPSNPKTISKTKDAS